MRLPTTIEARVLTSDGKPAEDLLVSVVTLLRGSDYYSAVMGLTSRLGEVRLTGEQLLEYFKEDQRTFPMDYKVALADCDPVLEIIVRGGSEFRELKRSSETTTLVDQEVRALYSPARNELFSTIRQRLDLTGSLLDTARVQIRLNPPL